MTERIALAAALIAASAAHAGEPILKLEMHEPLSQVNATALRFMAVSLGMTWNYLRTLSIALRRVAGMRRR